MWRLENTFTVAPPFQVAGRELTPGATITWHESREQTHFPKAIQAHLHEAFAAVCMTACTHSKAGILRTSHFFDLPSSCDSRYLLPFPVVCVVRGAGDGLRFAPGKIVSAQHPWPFDHEELSAKSGICCLLNNFSPSPAL